MNRFQLWPLCMILILLFIPRIQASRRNVVAFHTSSAKGSRQADPPFFHPPRFTGQASQFEEKRRVPTGSNPLHNKR
ncbi:hypothetical protein ES319_D07G211900v1 [Gossypium barbadense]|uniref:Uncharacterized protein n=2 Tax=Gossypium TaxID=3633 RepID=A0A5J5QVC6_GOSBA|nr:hypothetical protein ES319_D07G211900v1 [Gossypium barbadense]PPD99758.1 hypothetical protein GOBAR_DD03230 [Gossypium barbadense]TYG62413.1 hypothetical protein ES288_D07G228700v1 [Gossypium darwinii]